MPRSRTICRRCRAAGLSAERCRVAGLSADRCRVAAGEFRQAFQCLHLTARRLSRRVATLDGKVIQASLRDANTGNTYSRRFNAWLNSCRRYAAQQFQALKRLAKFNSPLRGAESLQQGFITIGLRHNRASSQYGFITIRLCHNRASSQHSFVT